MSRTLPLLPIAHENIPIPKSDQNEKLSIPDGDSASRIRPSSNAQTRFSRDVLGFIVASLILFYTVFQLGDGMSGVNQLIEGRIKLPTYHRPSISQLPQSTDQSPLCDGSDSDFDQSQDRALVTYVYSESPNSRKNALFFINHGLHAYADFIIILNGPTDLGSDIPRAPNIKVLVGMSMKCDADGGKRKVMQPMLFTTDRIGLSILLEVTGKCSSSTTASEDHHAVKAEGYAAQTILDAGYNITVMMPSLSPRNSPLHSCTEGEATGNDLYSDIYFAPYEMIFQQANRDNVPLQLELLTERHDLARYSSWDSCWLKRIRRKA
ncbi:hypothetical protein AA313_de0207705 [Arthrobotrys entomopaga]|nr:hypothetical protein AA313_de0207705 [Arthrobotrys entomopaga]